MATTIQHKEPDMAVVEGRSRSVAHLLLERAAKTPDSDAFLYADGDQWPAISWKQVEDRARVIAAGLIALGIAPQERVALACSTRVEWVLSDLGVMLAGAATTTIYPTTNVADVVHILNDSGSRVVLAENEEQVAKLREGRDQLSSVSKVVILEGEGDGDWVITLSDLEALGRTHLETEPDVVDQRIDGIQSTDLATLIYTSGTTGRPKGVRLSHDAWTYEAAATQALGILDETDLQYLWLPMAHVFGKILIVSPMQIGYPTAIDGRLDKIVDNLAVVRPTFMGAAPRIFEKVYGKISLSMEEEGGVKAKLFHWATGVAGQSLTSGKTGAKHKVADKLVLGKVRDRFGGRVRFFLSGSAALNPDIARWFNSIGLPIYEGYGMTESSAATTVSRPDTNEVGTVGPPLPGTQIKIAEDGEVLIKGPGVMQGYHGLDDATAETLVDGWLHTGDIGVILPSGNLKITDRKKDLFKTSGGKYVAPSAIESQFKGLCPYASQLVVEGENRKFVSALITLDEEGITGWAEHHGLKGSDYATIVGSDACRTMVQGYVDELNSTLNRWEQVKQFVLLPRDLTVEDGELTPSLKLKRKVVTTKFKYDLDRLYAE